MDLRFATIIFYFGIGFVAGAACVLLLAMRWLARDENPEFSDRYRR